VSIETCDDETCLQHSLQQWQSTPSIKLGRHLQIRARSL